MGVGRAGVRVWGAARVVRRAIAIMLTAANLALGAFSRQRADHGGQVLAITVMAIAASEVVVGLGMVVALSHLNKELDTDELAELHG